MKFVFIIFYFYNFDNPLDGRGSGPIWISGGPDGMGLSYDPIQT